MITRLISLDCIYYTTVSLLQTMTSWRKTSGSVIVGRSTYTRHILCIMSGIFTPYWHIAWENDASSWEREIAPKCVTLTLNAWVLTALHWFWWYSGITGLSDGPIWELCAQFIFTGKNILSPPKKEAPLPRPPSLDPCLWPVVEWACKPRLKFWYYCELYPWHLGISLYFINNIWHLYEKEGLICPN